MVNVSLAKNHERGTKRIAWRLCLHFAEEKFISEKEEINKPDIHHKIKNLIFLTHILVPKRSEATTYYSCFTHQCFSIQKQLSLCSMD